MLLAAGKGGWLSHTTRQEKERFREELKKLDIGLEERMSHPPLPAASARFSSIVMPGAVPRIGS